MMKTKTSRTAWWLAAILAAVVLGGVGLLGSTARSYWIARYRGEKADLHSALLIHAPLAGAFLVDANLRQADLAGADLTNANLTGARYDARTRWPDGFDPVKHGAILVK